MFTTKQAVAAAAVFGFVGALLSPPALAIVSTRSDQAGSMQMIHSGILLAEAEGGKKKAVKAKTRKAKEKKGDKSKGKAKGPGTSPSGSGEYD